MNAQVQEAKDKAEAIIADSLPDGTDRDLIVILVARGYMRGYIEGMERNRGAS